MRYDLPNTGDSLMPTSMLLIDVVGLTYNQSHSLNLGSGMEYGQLLDWNTYPDEQAAL